MRNGTENETANGVGGRDGFVDMVALYRERFDDSPPAYVFSALDPEKAVERLRHALCAGAKLPDCVPSDEVVI